MTRIQSRTPAAAARSTTAAAPKKAAASTAKAPQAKAGWAPKAASVSAAGKSKSALPMPAPTAKAFVDAYASGTSALSQMAMVASSQTTNQAGDAMLQHVAGELQAQLADRGLDKEADAVGQDLAKFFKSAGPIQAYHLDPDRGTMAALEDNGDRMTKVLGKIGELAAQLGKVNAEPSGENQQAYNRNAGGLSVQREAEFAVAFAHAYEKNGDEQVIKDAQSFFKALPKKVDSQIESRGGSMAPLEFAGATGEALAAMSAKFDAVK